MKPGPWEEDNIVLKSQSELSQGRQCRRLEATVTPAGESMAHIGLGRGSMAKHEGQIPTQLGFLS